jgi:hypothetical protein
VVAKESGVRVRDELGQIDYVPVSSLGGGGGGTPPVQTLGTPNTTDTLSTLGAVNEITARILAALAADPHVNVAANIATPNVTDAASTQAVTTAIATALSGIVHNPIVQNLATPNATDTPSTQAIATAIANALATVAHNPIVQSLATPNATDTPSTQAVQDAINAAPAAPGNPIVQNIATPNATDVASTQAVSDALAAALSGIVHNPIVQSLAAPNATDSASTQAIADAIAAALSGIAHNPIVQNLAAPNATDTVSSQGIQDALDAVTHNPIVQDLASPNATDTLSTTGVQNAINVVKTGQYLGNASDYSRLPPEPTDASVNIVYTAYVNSDFIGTGTALNPEFPGNAVYFTDGSGWAFSYNIGDKNQVVTDAQFLGVASTFVNLPVTTGASLTTRFSSYLDTDDIGTGDASNPQYPFGNYIDEGPGWVFSHSEWQTDQSYFNNHHTTVDKFITIADVVAENGHYGISTEATSGQMTLTIQSGLPDNTEIIVNTVAGNNNVLIIGQNGETIGSDITGALINSLGTVLFKKLGSDWLIRPIGFISLIDGSQPKLGDVGIIYQPFIIKTERENGSDAVFRITTQTNLAIWEVDGVEVESADFILPGTGLEQIIKVWVPTDQGVDFSATDAFITNIDTIESENIGADFGIFNISIAGSNNTINDGVGFSSAKVFSVFSQPATFTDQLAINSPLVEKIIAFGTSCVFTDDLTLNAKFLKELYTAGASGCSFTNTLTVNNNIMEVISIADSNSPLIDGGLTDNALNLRILDLNNLNLPSAAIDSLLISLANNTGLTSVFIEGLNGAITSASDAAYAILDALLGTELRIN